MRVLVDAKLYRKSALEHLHIRDVGPQGFTSSANLGIVYNINEGGAGTEPQDRIPF